MEDPWGRLPTLPADAILVHIGTHKTGTTALQADLEGLRGELATQGVTIPTTTVPSHEAARCLNGSRNASNVSWQPRRPRKQRLRTWRRYAREVAASPSRALISCEDWCECSDASAARLVRTLGQDRVHVIVAFRPLQSALPSSWQQYIKGGMAVGYEEWLKEVLGDPPYPATPKFWRRNDIASQLGRWSSLIGPERVVAVVVDSMADNKIRRSMERLLDLEPEAIRESGSVDVSNRSMTVAESQMLLGVNAIAAPVVTERDYVELVRLGAVENLVAARRPGPDEARLGLPEWAVPRVREIGAVQAADLTASGVHVVGEPDALAVAKSREPVRHPDEVPVESAEHAVIGAVLAASRLLDAAEAAAAAACPPAPPPPPTIGRRARNVLSKKVRSAARSQG